MNGERRGEYRVLMRKPEGWRSFGRPRRRWDGNIKIDLRETVWNGMDVAEDTERWRVLL
jgi:hypothetical protein